MSHWITHRTLAFRSMLVLANIALYGFLGYTGSNAVGAQSVGSVSSALVPAKFQETTIATGITSPTAMAIAPDGRIFVTQQDGRVRLIKHDALLTNDFYVVDADGNEEHGLLGIAVDPGFLNNQFVYLYYTARHPTLHNRLARVVASGDVAVPGSETILHELPDLPLGTKWHMGGALAFGPDGKLYVAVGNHEDSPMFPSVSQALSSPFGKILRFNADGTIPGDNPFLSASGADPAIWAIGLRNPFTFAIHRQSGLMFINDVGQGSWEEINLGVRGGNYGWSETEGPTSDPRFQSPVYAYPHSDGGCAVSGAAFYTPDVDQFPPEYTGKYLFGDFCTGKISVLDPATYAVQEFASGISFPVNLAVSPDGSVYYLARNEATGNPTQGGGIVGKVTYVGQAIPRITTQPISQTIFLGSAVSFTVAAQSALGYQWQRDGSDIPGATNPIYTLTSVSMADNGARFHVIVTNANGSVLSAEAVLVVTTDHLPEPQIVTPPVDSFYKAGDVLSFSGSASDIDEGNLPASALSWRIDYHHDVHTHPFLPETSGIRSGTVTIPSGDDVAADVWYRIWLTARDSQGLSKQVYRDVFPGASLATLPWVSATSGWGPIEKNMSNGELAAGDGQAITLDGIPYPKGLGVHAPSQIVYDLGGRCSGKFIADVGIDDEVGGGSVAFEVWLDGSRAFSSGIVTRQSARVPISLSVAGVHTLLLAVSDGGDGPSYDHADWGSARVTGCVFGTIGTLPSVTLSAAPASIASGQAATLRWSATNATSCAAAWTASTAPAGAQSVTPTATTTYTLTCTGASGTAAASTTVSINTPLSSLIPQQPFHVVSVDSQELVGENGAATNALDSNPGTFWHTEWAQRTAPLPHTLVLDLGASYQVDGFRYLPRQDGNPNGTIAGNQFSVSPDGTTWGTPAAAGTLAANTSEKTVRFTAKTGRFVRLVALSEINGQAWTSAAELNVFGTAVTSSTTTTSGLLAQSFTTSPVTSSALKSATAASQSTTPKAPITVSPVTSSALKSATAASQSTTKTASGTVSSLTSSASTPTMTASQNTRWEMTLTSTKTYANPFVDVTVTVEYTKAGSPSLGGYGFWDGDATFKLRQAFPEPGTWHYKTTATDPSDSGLHNREGDVQVLPYTGTNALYRHGFLQVSADHHFFAHADGTPFLWLGDTLWGATVWLTEAGFHDAVADRRAKHFTVLQTNFAREDEVDTAGDTPWQGDRWNVRFMQKLDRMFTDANDQGMYLFVNGLVDLVWDRGIPHYERLIEMIGARYAAHHVSFASGMADAYNPLHEQINAAIQRTAPRHLMTQHPGAATNGQGPVWTAEQYYDTPLIDYLMDATGGEGNLELACQQAIDWSLRLYNHVPPKPVVNGQAWYEGVAGGTAEMAAHLGYLSLLSGNVGYTYGTNLWDARDADLPAWKAFRGATYMQYLYDFFVALDEGRPLQPRHELIKNQATRYQDRMVLGVSADGMTYAAFLPQGGTISVDLKALAGTTVGVTWYNPLTGQYHDQGTTPGGVVRSFVSPFGASQSALVLMAP